MEDQQPTPHITQLNTIVHMFCAFQKPRRHIPVRRHGRKLVRRDYQRDVSAIDTALASRVSIACSFVADDGVDGIVVAFVFAARMTDNLGPTGLICSSAGVTHLQA
jgi:hypothetical protein